MNPFKKLVVFAVLFALLAAAGGAWWVNAPTLAPGQPAREFAIEPGSSVNSAVGQIAESGVPVNQPLLLLLARLSGKSAKIKAGHYELKPGASPLRLLDQLVRGEFAQESLTIIEGWTFRECARRSPTTPP